MSIINTWKAFIKAQEIFVNQYSEPFSIVFRKLDRSGIAIFQVEQKDPLASVLPSLEMAFPGITQRDINLKDGYLLYDSTKVPVDIPELEESVAANYFEFGYKPCFSGYIYYKTNPYKWLEEINGQRPNGVGQILATSGEIRAIDLAIESREGFSRTPVIGCILKFRPNKVFATKQYQLLISFLADSLPEISYSLNPELHSVVFNNIYISDDIKHFINEITESFESSHQIIIKINEDAFLKFEELRAEKNVFYANENVDPLKSTILPPPSNNEFRFVLDGDIDQVELQSKIITLRNLFARLFGGSEIAVNHHHSIKIEDFNLNLFYSKLQNAIEDERFNLSIDKETVSFDFISDDELNQGIEYLKRIEIADFDFKGADHAFKVKLEHVSPLISIETELQQIPALKTKLDNSELKLSFFCFFDNHDLLPLLVANIKDALDSIINDNMGYTFEELQDGKLKYFLNFKQHELEADLSSKFSYIRGEEIKFWKDSFRFPIGHITKVNFPIIQITIIKEKPSSFIDNVEWLAMLEEVKSRLLTEGTTTIVQCLLKGERDKIKRLADTIDVIFSQGKSKLLNGKLRSILIDSSKAETFPGDITLTQEYNNVIRDIDSSLLSRNINQRQKEAIAKCLIAEDFFIIQGPPGTGKSTAIAELIWQHIRANLSVKKEAYRVLVTSETNLAVDNALDKLRSNEHLLIKPIRLGSDIKLDKEGKRFSLESLKQWVSDDNKVRLPENSTTNVLEDWIRIIGKRASAHSTKANQQITNRWIEFLSNPNSEVRARLFNHYVQNANVFGATCSSIGKENSEQRFTRFFSDYCSVVHSKEYDSFRLSINKNTISRLKEKNIEFDLVVQDEASKASPPELALPCLFGKKAVVIGDHRQLPPMVDTNEFLDNLKMMRSKSKEEKNKIEISELIQYIKDNKEEFSISHFEKLFKSIDANLKSSFNIQYRMHPAINETIKQFYIEDGGLECGIPNEIADSTDMSHPLNRHHGVTNNKKTHVIWLDVNTPEIKSGTSRVNYGEVQAIDWLLGHFKKSPGYKQFIDFWPNEDVDQKQIGVITFYGAQASLLNKLSEKYHDVPLRISPVDRFQGMERNIVIVSLVRSNIIADSPSQSPNFTDYPEAGFPKQESLGFAEFPNRLNVALSRAKRLLIVVGNSKHFCKHEIYKKVYETILNHPNGSVKLFDADFLKQ
jgi:superfamily I DNA and/or RNA helicase